MNKPEKVFRIGSVSASVFANEVAKNRVARSVSVQRSYDRNGMRAYTSNFSLGDLPQVIQVLQLALNHMAGLEAEVKTEETQSP